MGGARAGSGLPGPNGRLGEASSGGPTALISTQAIRVSTHPFTHFASSRVVLLQASAAPVFRGVSLHSQQLIADVVASDSLYHSGSLPPDLQLPGLPEPNIEWLPHVPLIGSSSHAKPLATSPLTACPPSPLPSPLPSPGKPVLLQLARLREPVGRAFDRVPPPVQAWLPWETRTLVYCCGARLASLDAQSRRQQLYWGHTSPIAAVCAAQVHLQVPRGEAGGSVGSWEKVILTAEEDDGGRILVWRWPLTLPDSQVFLGIHRLLALDFCSDTGAIVVAALDHNGRSVIALYALSFEGEDKENVG